jgi:hypothetical protein
MAGKQKGWTKMRVVTARDARLKIWGFRRLSVLEVSGNILPFILFYRMPI